MDWRKTALDGHTLRSVLLRARRFWQSTFLQATSPVVWSIDPKQDDLIEQTTDTPPSCRNGSHGRRSAHVGRDSAPGLSRSSECICRERGGIPSSGSANPTLTIMQIAFRAAESVTAVW
jgi:hypothetical protein